MKIGIICAMQEEFDAVCHLLVSNNPRRIKQLELSDKYEVRKYKFYNDKIFVIRSGIGQNNAMIACAKLHHEYDCSKIYNIGTCGLLKCPHEANIPEVRIGDVFYFGQNIVNLGFELNPDKYHYDDCNITNFLGHDYVLATLNKFGVANEMKEQLSYLQTETIFVDMEAYAILSYCSEFAIDFDIIKVVSDYCDEEQFDANVSKEEIYSNLTSVIEQIICYLEV